MSNFKHRDNYPRERCGNYYEYQNMVKKDIYEKHLQQKHTKQCQIYSFSECATICKFIGEVIHTDLDRLVNKRIDNFG